jgi:hypothetical protein
LSSLYRGAMPKLDREKVRRDFARAVNMSAAELEEWLGTTESGNVGQKGADGESIGRAAGRRLLGILSTPEPELTDEDYLHMRRVAGFVARHRAQEPANLVTSRWRYSLMNWGHDPLKDLGRRKRDDAEEGLCRRYRARDAGE